MNQIHGTLKEGLFRGIKSAKNADPDEYIYSSYGIGFDLRSEFSLTDFSAGKNVFVFGADTGVSMHIANKGKNILILGKGPTQELNDIMLTDSSLKVQY